MVAVSVVNSERDAGSACGGNGERSGNIVCGCAVGERRAGSKPGSTAVSTSREERC